MHACVGFSFYLQIMLRLPDSKTVLCYWVKYFLFNCTFPYYALAIGPVLAWNWPFTGYNTIRRFLPDRFLGFPGNQNIACLRIQCKKIDWGIGFTEGGISWNEYCLQWRLSVLCFCLLVFRCFISVTKKFVI